MILRWNFGLHSRGPALPCKLRHVFRNGKTTAYLEKLLLWIAGSIPLDIYLYGTVVLI